MLSEVEKQAMEAVDIGSLMASVNEIARYERFSGSADELKSFHEIEAKMAGYGYRTTLFSVDSLISLPKSATLRLMSPEKREIFCITHSASVGTPAGGVEAEVVWAGDGQDISKMDVRGKFVMVLGLANPDTTAMASQAGALGQIHVSYDSHIHDMTVQNIWGNPDDQNIGCMPKTHVVSISRADGDAICELLAKGPVRAHMTTCVEAGWTKIPVLECSIDGTDGSGDFLMLSGHVDSWYYGAMDNGSANATMMEVARILATMRARLLRGVRVCFWSGHSHGRYSGSSWYCDTNWEELDRHCIMHLNTDSTGAVDANELKHASIMSETRNIGAWAISEVMGIPFVGSRIGRNGDQSFWGVGIPSMFVSVSSQAGGGLGWWWHNPADLPDKIDPKNLIRDTKIYALVASRLCSSEVLPFSYADTMDEWMETVVAVQSKVGARFDLSLVAGRIATLGSLVRQLASYQPESAHEAAAVNACLMQLGRDLVPVAFTLAGRFGQDPALKVEFLPDIAEVAKLASVKEGSDEEKLLNVRLVRGRNRVMEALASAIDVVEATLDELDE